MSATSPQQKRRLRAVILKLIYENREAQNHRLDDVTLTAVLEKLGHDVYVNLVREMLQDLQERGFVTFEKTRDRITGKTSIQKIQIAPAGADIVEETKTDPAVDVE